MLKKADDRVPTNLRALLILETLGQSRDPMSASDIGRIVGIPKQTAHRLCNTLADEGFLSRADGRGLFRPGRRARAMAAGTLHASTQHRARRQVLQWLAEQVGETVNFVVPEDQGMSYMDRVETNWAFRIQLPIGSHVPFHCTASGKTFLASLPRAERRRLVNVMQLTPLTDNTITDPASMLDELHDIARQGYAIDNEEFLDAMVAVSVPVRDPQGRYFASLAFHGPNQRLNVADLPDQVPLLTEAAARLSAVIFE
ncbi:MAG: IclR family transcriptional regulator [Silicimonas sp.]|nr:IclR family transcriptional regulator [Silicimonas sp.]